MATDQNIKKKNLALEIDTAYVRHMVAWHVLPLERLSLEFYIYF